MLTGKHPFAGKDGFVKRFTESPPAPSSIRSTPSWLDEVCATALARDPADRYPSAADLARALTLGLARERAAPKAAAVAPPPAASAERRKPTAVFPEKQIADRGAPLPPDVGAATGRANTGQRRKRLASIAAVAVAVLTLVGIAIATPYVHSAGF